MSYRKNAFSSCPMGATWLVASPTTGPKLSKKFERWFLLKAGQFSAPLATSNKDGNILRIELARDEALKTSAIEGEILNREVQSSLRQQSGLAPDCTAARLQDLVAKRAPERIGELCHTAIA